MLIQKAAWAVLVAVFVLRIVPGSECSAATPSAAEAHKSGVPVQVVVLNVPEDVHVHPVSIGAFHDDNIVFMSGRDSWQSRERDKTGIPGGKKQRPRAKVNKRQPFSINALNHRQITVAKIDAEPARGYFRASTPAIYDNQSAGNRRLDGPNGPGLLNIDTDVPHFELRPVRRNCFLKSQSGHFTRRVFGKPQKPKLKCGDYGQNRSEPGQDLRVLRNRQGSGVAGAYWWGILCGLLACFLICAPTLKAGKKNQDKEGQYERRADDGGPVDFGQPM